MGIAERKEREREEKRRKILQAAAELYVSEGFEKTTIRSIAQHIEYSPGTIYLYFKDKDEITSSLFKMLFAQFAEKLQEASAAMNPEDLMAVMGMKYLEFAIENPAYYELMFLMDHRKNAGGGNERVGPATQHNPALDCAPPEVTATAGDDGFNFLMQSLQAAADSGHKLRYDLHSATLTAWAGVHGVVSLYLRGFLDMYPEEQRLQMMKNAVTAIGHSIFEDS